MRIAACWFWARGNGSNEDDDCPCTTEWPRSCLGELFFWWGPGKNWKRTDCHVPARFGSIAKDSRNLGREGGWGFSNRVNFYFACFFLLSFWCFSFARRSIFFAEEINVGVCVCACLSGFYPSGWVLPAQDKTRIRRSGVYLIGMVPINLTMCCWFLGFWVGFCFCLTKAKQLFN